MKKSITIILISVVMGIVLSVATMLVKNTVQNRCPAGASCLTPDSVSEYSGFPIAFNETRTYPNTDLQNGSNFDIGQFAFNSVIWIAVSLAGLFSFQLIFRKNSKKK